jgi:hypothetical protein
MSEQEYTDELNVHVQAVRTGIKIATDELTQRGLVHDHSKLFEVEFEGYSEAVPYLKNKQPLPPDVEEKFHKAWVHHYTNNDHHPEYHTSGVMSMDFMSLIELAADWCAAMLRDDINNTDIENNVQKLGPKFHMDEQMQNILINTMKKMMPFVRARIQKCSE